MAVPGSNRRWCSDGFESAARPKPDAMTLVRNLAIAFEHYNEEYPRSALKYRSLRAYRRKTESSTLGEVVSGSTGANPLIKFNKRRTVFRKGIRSVHRISYHRSRDDNFMPISRRIRWHPDSFGAAYALARSPIDSSLEKPLCNAMLVLLYRVLSQPALASSSFRASLVCARYTHV